MDFEFFKNYYSNIEVKKKLLEFSKLREIGIVFQGKYFGKRPFEIITLNDINFLIGKNVTSFHMSEELWTSPILLGSEKNELDRQKNRQGWDLILDIDGLDFEYSRIATFEILNYLEEIFVKNVSVKFSGNKGFHIAIPFKAFSTQIIGFGETKDLYPKIPRQIATFLMHTLKKNITKKILELEKSIENISKKNNISLEKIKCVDLETSNLDVFKCVEIDTILISSRHLFRIPYSINEKSNLVSIPVDKKKILEFEKESAKVENVNLDKYKEFEFLSYDLKYGQDGDNLILKCIENLDLIDNFFEELMEKISKRQRFENSGKIEYGKNSFGDFFEIEGKVEEKYFPKTIKFVLENKFEDGKKRALFLLLTFFFSCKYDLKSIREIVQKWSEKHSSLKKSYIEAQILWFENKNVKISPPNFKNDNYYLDIGIPREIIKDDENKFKNKIIKNPLHFVAVHLNKKN